MDNNKKRLIENVVVVLDSEENDSKSFVSTAKRLGYRVRKINALRLPKEILNLYSSNEINQDEEYNEIKQFLHGGEKTFSYLVNRIDEHRKVTSVSTLSILVNSANYASRFQADYGAWFVRVSSSNRISQEHDWGIDTSLGFEKQVSKLLRVLTKNIKDVKYKEIE